MRANAAFSEIIEQKHRNDRLANEITAVERRFEGFDSGDKISQQPRQGRGKNQQCRGRHIPGVQLHRTDLRETGDDRLPSAPTLGRPIAGAKVPAGAA
jgi:hypothetical protein